MGPRGLSLGPLNPFFCAINTTNSNVTALQNTVAGKQDKLTFDSTPTENSSNPVTSGGVYTAINSAKVSEISGEVNENNELILTINGVTGSGIPLPDNQIELTPVFYPDYLSYSTHKSENVSGGSIYFKQGGQFNPTVIGPNVGNVIISGFEIERYYSEFIMSHYTVFSISTESKSRLFTELGLNKLPDGIYDVILINLFKFGTSPIWIPEMYFNGNVLHSTSNPTSFTVENGILTAHNDKNLYFYESNYATSTQELIVAVSCIRKYWPST